LLSQVWYSCCFSRYSRYSR